MSIAQKIILVVIFSLLVSSGSLAFLVYYFTKSTLESLVATQQTELARQTMNKIDRLMYERLNQIQALAEDEEFEGFITGKDRDDPKEFLESKTKLRELSRLTGPWENLSLINREGHVLLSQDGTKVGEHFFSNNPEIGDFESIFREEIYYSDVFLDKEIQKPSMIFAAVVRNEED